MQKLFVLAMVVAILVGIGALARMRKRPRRYARRRPVDGGSGGDFVHGVPLFGASDTRDGHDGSDGGWSDSGGGSDGGSDGGGGDGGGGGSGD
jgi:uncharacterized membrane protein YgcG